MKKLFHLLTLAALAAASVVATYAQGDPNLISGVFVCSGANFRGICSNDTSTVSGSLVYNPNGLIFTGQNGAWNGITNGAGNATITAVPVTSQTLFAGDGSGTSVRFAMTAKFRQSTGTLTVSNTLRNAFSSLNNSYSANPVTWQFTGLAPNGSYELALFEVIQSGTSTNSANGVNAIVDADGDANWSSAGGNVLQADGSGVISGALGSTAATYQTRIFGFQLHKLSPPLTADAGADQTVTALVPSATIGGSPTGSGGTGPYTYSWAPSDTLNDGTAANPIATPTATTTYTVTVTDSTSATATDSVVVNYSAALVASAGPPQTAMPTDPTKPIGGSPTAAGGTAPYTYSWSPTDGLDDPTASNPNASPTTTTTYTVTVTDFASATATASVVVTYYIPPLVVSAGAAQQVTPDVPSVSIGGSPTAVGGTLGYTYSWTPTDGLSDPTLANPTASPTTNTTYTVTVTDSTSETGTASVIVFYTVPDPALISVSFVAAGSHPTLPAWGDTSTNSGAAVYNGDGLMFTGQYGNWNGFNIDPLGNGNFTYTSAGPSAPLVNGTGTVTTVQFAITSSYRCNPGSSAQNGYLRNATAALFVPGFSGNPVTWQITGLVPDEYYQLAFFMDTGAGTNTANGVDGVRDADGDANWSSLLADDSGTINGSLSGASTSHVKMYGFQLHTLNVPLTVSAGSDQAVTPPSVPSVTIGGSPTASGGTYPYAYSWAPTDGLSDAAVANPTASPTADTTYTVTVTDAASATATASVVVTYTPPPLAASAGPDQVVTPPSVPSVTIGGSPTASGGTAPYTYSWSPTDGLSDATAANPTASPTVTTTYTVTVTDDVSATATASVVVTVSTPPEFPASGFSNPGGVPTFAIPDTVSTSTYTLFYKDNLTDPSWTALTGTGTGLGNGGTLTLSDPTPVGSLPATRFYRLGRNP